MSRDAAEAAKKIKMLLLDVDGVLTAGGIILDDDGRQYKVFHVRDGHGLKLLQREGIKVGIITGRTSGVVLRRAEELSIDEVYQGSHDKVKAYEQIKQKYGLRDEEVCYVGDDIVDIPVLKRVGLSVAVADATEETRAVSMMVTKAPGGRGAVREVVEFILKAKGRWEAIVDRYMAS